MTALRVILIVLAVLWLIGLIRLKGFVEYSEEGVLAQLRVLWFKITLFPPKPQKDVTPKPKKPKKTKKPKKPREKPKDERSLAEKVGGLWSLFRDAVPMVCQAAGRLLRKLRIEELTLHLTWAAEDPAEAALGYGAGEAALATVWPMLERTFDIRRRDVGIAVDFTRAKPVIYVRALLSFTVGQLVCLGLIYGCKALGLLLRHKPKRKASAETTR